MRSIRGRTRFALAALVATGLAVASSALAQLSRPTSAATVGPRRGQVQVELDYTPSTPVKAAIRAGVGKEVLLVGRTEGKLAFTEPTAPGGTRPMFLEIEKVEEVYFRLELAKYELDKAVRARRWATALQLLLGAVRPTLPYLDLPENNAAQLALEAGNYAVRDAEQAMDAAQTDEQKEAAVKKYGLAYSLFKYVGKAQWYSGGDIGRLKAIKCLLAVGKPKTARMHFEQVPEPNEGDVAIGLYWLVKAEMDVGAEDFRAAMAAAVKSLCFENKDIDTFPDALMISARCYEEFQEWYRARDVYFEVARVFPRTDWAEAAIRRLKFIVAQGLTAEEEPLPIENVFFRLEDDVNQRVVDLLEDQGVDPFAEYAEGEEAAGGFDENRDYDAQADGDASR